MRIPQPSRVSRVRGAVVAVFAAMVLALPLGVLASHQFGDVPNSNIFHGDVDALVDAGVTAGCGGGNYCPNQAVTRGQMAAFMNRLGALAPGKVPVVNADRLDGLNSTAFHPFGSYAPSSSLQTGAFMIGSGNGDELPFSFVSYPVPVATPLAPHVIFPGEAAPAGCSGSVTAPNASAGHFCLFIGFNANFTDIGVFSPYTGAPGTGREGAVMNATIDTPGMVAAASGTWAARSHASGGGTMGVDPDPSGPNILGD